MHHHQRHDHRHRHASSGQATRRRRGEERARASGRWRLGFMALLMLPLLLAVGAPVAAAIVPGALLTAAAWSGGHAWFESSPRMALPAAQVVDPDDPIEAARIARAEFVGRVDATV